MIFYTYLWLRRDGTPYYVGKGCWGRGHTRRAFRKGCPSIDRIIIQDHASEEEAFAVEIFLISFYGRKDLGTGCLRNLTDGGEGISGYQPTPEVRKIWSNVHKGKPFSEKHRQSLSRAARHRTPEHLAKIAASLTGKPGTRRGQKFSEETRRKMSVSMRAAWAAKKVCNA